MQRRAAKEAQANEAKSRRAAERLEISARRRAYAADMNLLQQALAVDNLGRARQLLYRQIPSKGQQDLRGWEWRFAWQYCQSDAQSVLCQKEAPITSLAVSADGKWLAVGEQTGGRLSVWNLATREEIRVSSGAGWVCAAFSPLDSLLAIATIPEAGATDPQHRVRFWSPISREFVKDLPIGRHDIGVDCTGLFFSPDGQTLITSMTGSQNEISLWRFSDGKKVGAYPAPASPSSVLFRCFTVSADASTAAYKTQDGTPRVIDLATGAERWSATTSVQALAFSPDGTLLACGPAWVRDTAIALFEVDSGREIGRLQGHRRFVGDLVFRPDGKLLASASGDQTIRVWDMQTRRTLRTLRGHELEVWKLALLPDQTTLVSGCKDGSVYFWDVNAPGAAHGQAIIPSVRRWCFAADDKSVVTIDTEGQVVQWQEHGKKSLLLRLEQFLQNPVQFAADAPLIAVGSAEGRVQVWNWETRQHVQTFMAGSGRTYPLQFLGRGKKVFVADHDHGELSVHEFDVATGTRGLSLRDLGKTRDFSVAFSTDEKQGIIVTIEGNAWQIDLEKAGVTRRTLNLGRPWQPSFSADGGLLAIPSAPGYVRLWDAKTLREVATFSGFIAGVHTASFTPDGARLVTGSGFTEAIRLWDLQSNELVFTLPADTTVYDTAISRDGNVVGALGNRLLHLWRAPSWEEIDAAESAAAAKEQKP
jgi:WD40 repeat protein